jgi:uncharacterized protein
LTAHHQGCGEATRSGGPAEGHHRFLLSLVPMLAEAAVACVLFAALATADTPAEAHTNRLIHSASPYLLQHAHNPVDWYPWGEEAIAKAKKENKLIFLSIGYSTCYWCHVAERTIYSNPVIAALMNQWFVNIKVDREERPDIDGTFMRARRLLTDSGGWPNNLFLTPDLKPFFAGSYFPPEDQESANGFPTILKLIHGDWEKNPIKIKEIGDQVQTALSGVHDTGGKPASVLKIMPADWLAKARDQVLGQRDKVYGGLNGGGGTKFPQSPVINLLLTDYRVNGTAESLQAVTEMLNAMALGGIHDHLGGGIHRYSTEPTWSVPHFEKMLYDNAQLIGLYADYYAITRQPLERDMAMDIAGYLARRMTAPKGAFYTAEDADIEGKEGESYLWTRAEITDVLGSADADRFFDLYELTPLPNEPSGPGVLRIRRDQTASKENRAGLADRIAEMAPMRASWSKCGIGDGSRHAMTRSSWPSTASPSLDLRTQEGSLANQNGLRPRAVPASSSGSTPSMKRVAVSATISFRAKRRAKASSTITQCSASHFWPSARRPANRFGYLAPKLSPQLSWLASLRRMVFS